MPRLTIVIATLGFIGVACASGDLHTREPHMTGGDCGTTAFEGHCELTAARIGPHPEASGKVLVDTNWRPEDGGTATQYFTCGPAFAVPADKGEALKKHIRASGARACKGTFATGSCNPCPVAAMQVNLPPFEDAPLVPVSSELVRF